MRAGLEFARCIEGLLEHEEKIWSDVPKTIWAELQELPDEHQALVFIKLTGDH